MIRKSLENISDEEFEKILKPFNDNYEEFIESYIIPEVVAYYIANSYYRNSMFETSFIREYNSAVDTINSFVTDYEKVKSAIYKLLRVKYALIVVNEEPLEFKKIEY